MFLRLSILSSLILLSSCWGAKEEEKIEAAPGQESAEVSTDSNTTEEQGAVSEESATEQAPQEVAEEQPVQQPEAVKKPVTVQEAPKVVAAPIAQRLPETVKSEPKTSQEGYFQYIVVKNDTLSEIAGRVYGDMKQWRLLASSNPGIRNPNLIYPGDKLNIPVNEAKSQEFSAGYVEMQEKQVEMVQVEKGDTLSRIAATKLGTSENWPVIYAMNKDVIHNPNAISVGMRLKVCPGMIKYRYGSHHNAVGAIYKHKNVTVAKVKTLHKKNHAKMIGGVSVDLINSILAAMSQGTTVALKKS